jgi:ABC-type phosphate transport system substrate-binding protein
MSIISASILLTHRNAIAEVVIIVNKSVSIDTMSQSTISNIYFGNMTKWPDGKTIHVVMLKGGKTHETYVKKILVSTPSRLISYWKKVVFTGIGIRPKIFKNEQDLVSYVSNTKGTIGYIDDSVLDESVKVVTIIQ